VPIAGGHDGHTHGPWLLLWDSRSLGTIKIHGNYGSYETTREGRYRSSGAYCREYKSTINIGGWDEYSVGTACCEPDGTWKIIS
jgi:hypothetical protein